MSLLFIAALLLQEKSPDESFAAIAGRIDSARTLTVRTSVEETSRGSDGNSWRRTSWTLLMKDENKVRLTIKSRGPTGETEVLYVSDGKTTREVGRSFVSSKETPWNLVPSLKDSILRGGPELVMTILFCPVKTPIDSPSGAVSDLKNSGTQKESRLLEYKFTPAIPWAAFMGKIEPAEVTLTFDPRSFQVVKRYVHSKRQGSPKSCVQPCPPLFPDVESWTTETFDEFKLNADISDDLFKLPEKK